MKSQTERNKKYLKKNGLTHLNLVIPEIVKYQFRLATIQNGTTMTDILVKAIHKYNTAYINK